METTLEPLPEETPLPSRRLVWIVLFVLVAVVLVSAFAVWQLKQNEPLATTVESCAPAYLRNMDTTGNSTLGLPTIGQPMSAEALAAAVTTDTHEQTGSACAVAP
jgi:hypothetical protein